MELFESTVSLGIDSYFKHERKKLSQKIHFLKPHRTQDQYQINILLTHRNLSHFRFLIQDLLQKKNFQIHQKIHTHWTLENKLSFDYFYLFYHESICIYFFRQNGKDHIFFEGLHKWSDLKNINVIQWIRKKKLIQMKSFLQKGTLLQVQHCNIIPILQDDFLSIFTYIQNNHYSLQQNIYSLIIEGYSLGGIYLQLFIQLLEEKKLLHQYEFEAYQMESWFQGTEKEYELFCQKIKITNIMKYGSYFHLYNSLFQKYRKIHSFVKSSKETQEILESDTPFRILEYGIVSHML